MLLIDHVYVLFKSGIISRKITCLSGIALFSVGLYLILALINWTFMNYGNLMVHFSVRIFNVVVWLTSLKK
jgi:hypothetical protein